MNAEQVIQKIIADAKAEAEKIVQQAEDAQAQEQSDLDRELEQYREQSAAIAEKAGQDEKSHILAAARMKTAKQLLSVKREVLDGVFEQAKQQLQKLSDDEYRKLMSRLMREAVETGDEEVLTDKNETRIDHEFVKNVNRELGPGYKGNLRLSDEKLDLGGGFVLRRGKIKTNISFDVLIDQARKELEIELAKELFSQS